MRRLMRKRAEMLDGPGRLICRSSTILNHFFHFHFSSCFCSFWYSCRFLQETCDLLSFLSLLSSSLTWPRAVWFQGLGSGWMAERRAEALLQYHENEYKHTWGYVRRLCFALVLQRHFVSFGYANFISGDNFHRNKFYHVNDHPRCHNCQLAKAVLFTCRLGAERSAQREKSCIEGSRWKSKIELQTWHWFPRLYSAES